MPRMVFPQYKRGRNGIECGEGTILDHARRLGVSHVAPCHCSGEAARAAFKQAYGERYVAAGVGYVFRLRDLETTTSSSP